jgi:hypothetical protein
MHIEAVRLDAHPARDLHGRAAADHRIGKYVWMQKFENLAVNIA